MDTPNQFSFRYQFSMRFTSLCLAYAYQKYVEIKPFLRSFFFFLHSKWQYSRTVVVNFIKTLLLLLLLFSLLLHTTAIRIVFAGACIRQINKLAHAMKPSILFCTFIVSKRAKCYFSLLLLNSLLLLISCLQPLIRSNR